MLKHALWYASMGWRVLPLHNIVTDASGKPTGCSCGNRGACDPSNPKPGWGKHPRISEWQVKATTDPSVIEEWFDRWPSAQIGLATGPDSNLFVLDIDGEEGIEALRRLEEDHASLPETWVVETGSGGLQFYFLWPDQLGNRTIANRAKALAEAGYPGIDWRADRGQVVAPPGYNRNGGYEIVHQAPPAAPPDWLIDLVAVVPPPVSVPPPALAFATDQTGKRVQAFVQKCLDRVATAPEGTRNHTLYASVRAAAEIIATYQTLSEGEAESAFTQAALSAGLTAKEIRQTFLSAWKDGVANPKPLHERPWAGPPRRPAAVAPPPQADPAEGRWEDGPPLPPFPEEFPGEAFPPDLPEIRLTDTGNARILTSQHGQDIRFNAVAKGEGWMTWDDTRWIPDPTNQAERWAKAVAETWFDRAERFKQDCLDAYRKANPEYTGTDLVKDDEKIYGSILAFGKRTENKSGIQGTLFALRSEPGISVGSEQWDGQLMRLTAKNKSINLETRKGYEHDRSDYSTRRASANLTPGAPCPLWLKFLSEIMVDAKGTPRPHLVEYLQRWCGYCLTGSTQEQVFAILWGKGSNGKSTFVEVLRYVLGDYAVTTKADTLMNKERGSGIPNDIAALAGARLVTAAETEKNKHLNEGLVKEITGGDTITARFLHKEFFEFEPRFKLMLTTNNKPVIRGTDEGIWRRIHLIPFEAYFKKPNDSNASKQDAPKADDTLKDRLKKEADGILNWMLEGLAAWQKDGLKPPEEVLSAIKTYRAESDVLAEFIEEHTEKEPAGDGVLKSDLYVRYTQWCEASGEHPMKQRTLTAALEERGWREQANRATGRRWEAIRLKARGAPAKRSSWEDRFGTHPGDN